MTRQELRDTVRFVPGILFGIASGLFFGCGAEDSGPKFYPVAGSVLVGEKPVPEGTVTFRPDANKGNQSMHIPTATIRPDGSYELETNGKPGAPPGWYRVLVLADNFRVIEPPPSPVWPNYPEGFLPKPLVNERYLYFHTTDIQVEVKEHPEEDAYLFRLNP
jgi:hypothetical protein